MNCRKTLANVLGAGVAVAAACSPAPSVSLGARPSPTPLPLDRCDERPGIVCLVTFGVEAPDRMVIALLLPAGGFKDLSVEVEYNAKSTPYFCHAPPDLPHNFYCSGPQLPLGSTLRIAVSTGEPPILLARGEFVLNALALPTVQVGTPPDEGAAYPNP